MLHTMRIFVINASQMQSVAYASSCFAVMLMNARSHLIRAPAAKSPFALTAHLRIDATRVCFSCAEDAHTRRTNATIAVSTIAAIAKEEAS